MPERGFMIAKIIQYLQGYVRVRITGYSPERFLNLCSRHKIRLWGLKPCGHAYEMYLTVGGFRRLRPILRKSHMKIRILERRGLPFFLYRSRRRQAFFAGAVCCLILVYLMSLRIWNIHIEGNYSHTDDAMLQFLASKEICHGMAKRNIDCSKIVKEIRSAYDDVIWVSASIDGTRLIVQMKENMDTLPEERQEDTREEAVAPSDIVSDMSGTVSEIVTRKGVPMVSAGSEIKEGDLLVSGMVPVLDDSKEVAGYQHHVADADIFVRTEIPYEHRIKISYKKKVYSKHRRYAVTASVGPYRFELGILSNQFPESEVYAKEKRLRIGEHFDLPIKVGLKIIRSYEFSATNHTDAELRKMQGAEFERFCEELKKKGVQILENNVKIYKDHGEAVAKGSLTVIRTAGRTVPSAEETEQTEGEKS